ncbi:MAG: VCBS repeat-containing protein [Planctomycetota bacterium]
MKFLVPAGASMLLCAGLLSQSTIPQFSELTPIQGSPSAPYGFGMAVADFDGDGTVDVATGPWGGALRVFRGDGLGGLAEVANAGPPARVFTQDLVVGDVDGDGDLDAVVVNFQRPLQLYLNNGDATFSDESVRVLGTDGYNAAELGDFDSDGDLDLFIVGDRMEAPFIALNAGNGRFTGGIGLPPLPANARRLRSADFDGDGDLDAIVATTGTDVLLINDGRGVMMNRSSQLPAGTESTDDVAIGDVDGDGDLDLVLGQATGISINRGRVLLNDGQANFTDLGRSAVTPDPMSVMSSALGDIDEDGDLDLVFGTWNDTPLQIYLNDGTGQFTLDASRAPPEELDATRNVAFADIDDDGDLDLVLGNQWTGTTQNRSRVYANLHRQTHAFAAPRIGSPWAVDLFSQPGYGTATDLGFTIIGSARGATPLGVLGVLQIDPAGSAAVGPVLLLPPEGRATLAFDLPTNPGLIGTSLLAQSLVVSTTGTARLTNLAATTIGRAQDV